MGTYRTWLLIVIAVLLVGAYPATDYFVTFPWEQTSSDGEDGEDANDGKDSVVYVREVDLSDDTDKLAVIRLIEDELRELKKDRKRLAREVEWARETPQHDALMSSWSDVDSQVKDRENSLEDALNRLRGSAGSTSDGMVKYHAGKRSVPPDDDK